MPSNMEAGRLKLWTASLEIKAEKTVPTSGEAGIINYDQNAGTAEFSNGFEVVQGQRKFISRSDNSRARLEIATGKLKINGPTKIHVIIPPE